MYDGVFSTFIVRRCCCSRLICCLASGVTWPNRRSGPGSPARPAGRVGGLPGPGELGRVADGLLPGRCYPEQQASSTRSARATWTPAHRAHRPGDLQQLAGASSARRPTRRPSSSAAPARPQTFSKTEMAEGKDAAGRVDAKKAGLRRRGRQEATATPTCRASPAAGSGSRAAGSSRLHRAVPAAVQGAGGSSRCDAAADRECCRPSGARRAAPDVCHGARWPAPAGQHARGRRAGRPARLLVISLFKPTADRPVAGVLITGVTTVVLWAVARPSGGWSPWWG